jgi:putative oxidoreductase
MKAKLPHIARILLGLVFTFGGIAGLLSLGEMPPDLPEKLTAFNNGLLASGYFFPLLKITETICGLLLISGFFVPLALVILAPIVLNIVMVHTFLEPSGLPLAIILGLLLAYLAFMSPPYAPVVKTLFRKK